MPNECNINPVPNPLLTDSNNRYITAMRTEDIEALTVAVGRMIEISHQLQGNVLLVPVHQLEEAQNKLLEMVNRTMQNTARLMQTK